MGFADTIRTLANQIQDRRVHVATEEAAKQALILPFLAALGYDIYNPAELVPEYKAGWAKATEKIDYAVQSQGKPILFVEAKGATDSLTNHDAQLSKYFNATPEVKFAIITNGIQHRFFTDLQEPNLLDKKPFFEFDFDKFTDADIAVLERFRKGIFNAESLVGYAEDLVFLGTLKTQFKKLLREPSDEFISFAVKEAAIVETRVTQKVIDRFRPLVKESISAAILEIVQQSLLPQAAALEEVVESTQESTPDPSINSSSARVETTPEESDALRLVQTIVTPHVPEPTLVVANDTSSYFAVQYKVTTRWFVRFWIQDKERKAVVVRLADIEQAKRVCPSIDWEANPGGNVRAYFNTVAEIESFAPAIIEAVKGVL